MDQVNYASGDDQAFRDIVASLPQCIEYRGEFGPELVLFLPFCKWLSQAGLTASRTVSTYIGMECFYDDLGFDKIIERNDSRVYVQPEYRAYYLPRKNENTFEGMGRSGFHLDPDLRMKFITARVPAMIAAAEKPLCVIHNKYTDEWGRGPVNFLGLDLLDKAFGLLSQKFQVVYIRHSNPLAAGYGPDHNEILQFNDNEVVYDHPDIIDFDRLATLFRVECGTKNVNLIKSAVYSRCYNYVTSQGGGAHQIASFSGSVMSILHRGGDEISWAYTFGYYNFLSNPAPIRMVCTNDEELLLSLTAQQTSVMHEGRACLNGSGFEVAGALKPGRWGAPRYLRPAT